MPVTGYQTMRQVTPRRFAASTSSIAAGPEWVAGKFRQAQVFAGYPGGTYSTNYLLISQWSVFAFGAPGVRLVNLVYADVVLPLAPEGTYSAQFRCRFANSGSGARPPRLYVDHRGLASIPASLSYRYFTWPWRAGFDQKRWRFADPRLYGDPSGFLVPGIFGLSITAANFVVRYYY